LTGSAADRRNDARASDVEATLRTSNTNPEPRTSNAEQLVA
jgi:hypothetical protein